MIGTLSHRTACHSFQSRGTIEKRPCKNGMYKRAKWRAIEREMAYTSIMFSQSGSVRRDSLDERAFMAFNISMTTRMDRDIVDADLAMSC